MTRVAYLNVLFVPLIAIGGCGPKSERPNDLPPVDSPGPVPVVIEPIAGPPAPLAEAEEGMRWVPGLRRSLKEPLHALAVETGDPELDPLISYLKASFAGPIEEGRRLVIHDMTDMFDRYDARGRPLPPEDYQRKVDGFLKEAAEQVPAEMIRDFGEKNRGQRAVWPELTRHLPASLLTPEEHKAIFSGVASDGWERFYAKYPEAYAIITVSRVGLSRDKTVALFFIEVSQGSLNGFGQLHVLKKEGNVWVELPIEIGSTWNA